MTLQAIFLLIHKVHQRVFEVPHFECLVGSGFGRTCSRLASRPSAPSGSGRCSVSDGSGVGATPRGGARESDAAAAVTVFSYASAKIEPRINTIEIHQCLLSRRERQNWLPPRTGRDSVK